MKSMLTSHSLAALSLLAFSRRSSQPPVLPQNQPSDDAAAKPADHAVDTSDASDRSQEST
jgi:hypothetical protein